MTQHLVFIWCALGIRTRNKTGGLAALFLASGNNYFTTWYFFLCISPPARICTRVFCTAKLFVAPEGLIFAAKAEPHLHGHVMRFGIVKH